MSDTQGSERSPFGEVQYDPVNRQKTTCKIWVFSHNHKKPNPMIEGEAEGKINCTRDVIQCQTGKTIKAGGGANFTLVPRRNYMNMIFPDDYVNIYFDVNDGRGFIRVFFGFVDRIHRTIQVDPATGSTTTRFQIVCSDFTKAFVKTNIYFNPHIRNRKDLIGDFAGTANLGGVALRVKGVSMHGSPADIVLSLIHLLLGFGSQFTLPKSYPLPDEIRLQRRRKRVSWALKRISQDVKDQLPSRTEQPIKAFEQLIKEEAADLARGRIAQNEGVDSNGNVRDPTTREVRQAEQEALRRRGIYPLLFSTESWRTLKSVIRHATPNSPSHLIDLIDLSLLEWELMDGYVMSQSITWTEGSLWQIMNSWSNDFVNELFCDLRPVTKTPSPGGATSGGKQSTETAGVYAYSKEEDELGDIDGNTDAVAFVPSIVMREYPFSTVEGVNPPSSIKVLNAELGLLYFGAIFSSKRNEPGRHFVKIPALHQSIIEKYKDKISAMPKYEKHLDVATISITDITNEQIGRSDADHVNLIEVYSDITSGQMQFQKFITQEIQPLITAINIARHGLRVRKYTTKFGRFSSSKNARGGQVDNAPNRRLLVRWAMLLDHWYQHNLEYLSGSMNTRGKPEIRVGYRLDVLERNESYYVEGVSHNWSFPGPLTSALTLTRGQRNDPFPIYVLPNTKGFDGLRRPGSRLEEYFEQRAPDATKRSHIIFGRVEEEWENAVDDPYTSLSTWAVEGGVNPGYLEANSSEPSEAVQALEQELQNLAAPSSLEFREGRSGYEIVDDAAKSKGTSSGGESY